MNIAFLNHSISRNSGGVFEVEQKLANCLSQIKDVHLKIVGMQDDKIKADLPSWYPFEPKIHKIVGPHSFGFAPNLVSELRKGIDLIHLHVLWLYPSIACMRSGVPYITTIHGMLDDWALKNSSLKKRIVSFLYERAALDKASCLQATTAKEYEDIRKFGLKNPVCLIPNGVDLPKDISALKNQVPVWKDKVQNGKKLLLYLGRIHPKKGLNNLIKGWHSLKKEHFKGKSMDWELVIAGWDQGGFEDQLKKMVEDLDLKNDIHFVGPQFGKNKELAFAHADAFILPSFSEGLPIAVLEAWAFNLPVVMTQECNLPEGFETKSAFQIETSAESIAKGLLNLFLVSDKERQEAGANGKSLVAKKFNWQNIANELHDVYNWILTKDRLPESLILK